MEYAHETTSITDGLFEPYGVLLISVSGMIHTLGVFLDAVGFVAGGDWEDEEEGEGGTGDKGEEIGVGEGVDVSEGEGGGDAKGVD